MSLDVSAADPARAFAVLLHPHPQYGGDRFHPFIDLLHRRLPAIGVSAVRFDFSSADPDAARAEVVGAIDEGTARWPGVPTFLVGYSFGAGVAAVTDDERVAGWYLLAPQVPSLSSSPIGRDTRPKAIAVPENDQFSPPRAVEQAVSEWVACTVTTLPGADHFLGAVGPVVDGVVSWIAGRLEG